MYNKIQKSPLKEKTFLFYKLRTQVGAPDSFWVHLFRGKFVALGNNSEIASDKTVHNRVFLRSRIEIRGRPFLHLKLPNKIV